MVRRGHLWMLVGDDDLIKPDRARATAPNDGRTAAQLGTAR